jgi:hypothetical protein
VKGAAGVTLCALPASGAEGSPAGCLVMNVMAAVIRLAPMMATPMNAGRGCLAYSAKHPRSHFMAVLMGASRAGPFPPGCALCQRPGNSVLSGFAVALSLGQAAPRRIGPGVSSATVKLSRQPNVTGRGTGVTGSV